jgi:hypothetical protein
VGEAARRCGGTAGGEGCVRSTRLLRPAALQSRSGPIWSCRYGPVTITSHRITPAQRSAHRTILLCQPCVVVLLYRYGPVTSAARTARSRRGCCAPGCAARGTARGRRSRRPPLTWGRTKAGRGRSGHVSGEEGGQRAEAARGHVRAFGRYTLEGASLVWAGAAMHVPAGLPGCASTAPSSRARPYRAGQARSVDLEPWLSCVAARSPALCPSVKPCPKAHQIMALGAVR